MMPAQQISRAYYRFYCQDGGGKFLRVDESHCETDDDALAHAAELLGSSPHCATIEVWNLARIVGRVG
jgi:hypothetical protein